MTKPDLPHTLLYISIVIIAALIGLRTAGRVDASTGAKQAAYEQASVMAAGIAQQNAAEFYK